MIARDKCGYADAYKGMREPTCGCLACWGKWLELQVERTKSKSFIL